MSTEAAKKVSERKTKASVKAKPKTAPKAALKTAARTATKTTQNTRSKSAPKTATTNAPKTATASAPKTATTNAPKTATASAAKTATASAAKTKQRTTTSPKQSNGSASNGNGDGSAQFKLGDILLHERLVTKDQLNEAIEFQKSQSVYTPLGEILVKLRFVSQVALNAALKKYRKSIPLGELLLNLGLIAKDQLEQALDKQQLEKKRLGEILIQDGYISEISLLNTVSLQMGIKKIVPNPHIIDRNLLKVIKPDYCRKHLVLPAFKEKHTVVVIMANPLDQARINDLESIYEASIEPAIASPREIKNALNRIHGFKEDEFMSVLKEDSFAISDSKVTMEEGDTAVEAVDFIVSQAVLENASDIHIEPMSDRLRIRYRIDGVPQHRTDFPLFLGPSILARIKALGELDLAEKRRHQDGRIQAKILNREVDLRISTYAAINGENIVIRILDHQSAQSFDIDQLGFSPANYSTFINQLKIPTGVILATGPTGSGKTTTLYASLNYLNDVGRVIITVEDPVELEIDGIVQAQLNPKMNLNYTDFIRAMMRQDPDTLMVGEIRDKTAAEAVVQCALTGHKVLSTFHTDDTTGALLRLMDMGINTFLISSTIVSVCSQRLIRTICPRCKETYRPEKEILQFFSINSNGLENHEFFRGKGCAYCNYTGFKGRIGIHELLIVNDEIRDAILARRTSSEIRGVSRRTADLVSLQEDGFYKCLRGMSTPEEVLRVASYSDVDRKLSRTADELIALCEEEGKVTSVFTV